MENNVKSFLENIKEIKNENFEVFQVSSKSNIQCSPLTFKQQKELMGTVAEGTIGVLKFQKYLNNILEQNTGVDLSIIDKIPVILKLRAESIGYDIKIDDAVVNIEKNIKESLKIKQPKSKIISDKIEIVLNIPSLKEENKIISHAVEHLKKDEKDVGKSLVGIFSYEILKYIESVKFGENELKFTDLSVKDRLEVVENLPLKINKQIVSYIEKIKNMENECLKVDIDGETKYIDIDVSFFDN